jgi:23S rRNA (cytosine1962-C5)-methyltransferase
MPAETKAKTRLRLRVTAAAEAALRGGHPWLFAESIREQNRQGAAGELAVVYDRKNRFLAIGLFDPDSPIRMRALHVGKPVTLDREWWRARLRTAIARRHGLFDERTTGYRCIHGEGDGWPGLVLDRYGSAFVLKLYSAAWLPRIREISGLLNEELRPGHLVLRLSRNIREVAARKFDFAESLVHPGAGVWQWGSEGVGSSSEWAPPTPPLPHSLAPGFDAARGVATFLESGLRFEADVVRGAKTGFFLDQRENRRRVELLAGGCDVLNAFSFSGGFSLYAARGGARSVTDLDISPRALESAGRNFAMNQDETAVARCGREAVQAEAFEWLENNTRPRFDLVILDPPSLAKRETERAGAIRAYARLAEGGIRMLRRGGLLVASSCSAHVTAEEFFGAVRQAVAQSRRRFQEVATTRHPPDHPATIPEAAYLKCVYLLETK